MQFIVETASEVLIGFHLSHCLQTPLAVSFKDLRQQKKGESAIVGTTISYYKVIEKIGEGGMGEVWKATDTTANRDVALRILPEQFAMGFELYTRY